MRYLKEKIKRFILTAPFGLVVGIPLILGFLIICIVLYWVDEKDTSTIIPLRSLIFLFFGSAGIPMIIRKEAPGIFRNEVNAVIQGYTLVISCWTIAILSLVLKF